MSGSQWMGQTLAEVWTSEFGKGDRMRPIVDRFLVPCGRTLTRAVGVVALIGLAGCSDEQVAGGAMGAGGVESVPSLCEVDPCAREDCDRSNISCPDELPPEDPEPDSALQLDRTFDCFPEGVRDGAPVGQVAGLEGAFLSLRTASPTCQFDLVFHGSDGAQTVISDAPDGYFFAAARRLPSGDVVACVTAIQHRAHDAAEPAKRFIERTRIRCARQIGDDWMPMVDLISPDGPWAAWLDPETFGDSAAIPGDDGRGQFALLYARDFSFQFLNTVNTGRPGEDGMYRQDLDLSDGGLTALGAPVRVGDISANVPTDEDASDWTPTEEEIAEFEAFVDGLPPEPDAPAEGGAP